MKQQKNYYYRIRSYFQENPDVIVNQKDLMILFQILQSQVSVNVRRLVAEEFIMETEVDEHRPGGIITYYQLNTVNQNERQMY
jgi:hypothetical protein